VIVTQNLGDHDLGGLSRRTGPFGGPYVWDRSLLESPSQHTAQSPFRSRVAMGGLGVSDKEFLEVFLWLGARAGCGRLFLLGGRVDLAGILRSDDCCRPSTGEVLIGRQGHASWSVEPREAFEGPQGRGVGAGENYCGGRRILGGSQPDPRGDLGGRGGVGDLAGHIGGQVLDRARLSRVQQVIHVPQ